MRLNLSSGLTIGIADMRRLELALPTGVEESGGVGMVGGAPEEGAFFCKSARFSSVPSELLSVILAEGRLPGTNGGAAVLNLPEDEGVGGGEERELILLEEECDGGIGCGV